MHLHKHQHWALLGLVAAVPVALAAAVVTIPNTFENGEIADADEVNANFDALASADRATTA